MRNLLLTCLMLSGGSLLPAGQEPESPTPAPLLPDGSFIREAQGDLHRTEPGQPWLFRIDAGGADQELTLLPSHLLEEIEFEISDRSDQTVNFILSGQVLLYRNQNYLILEHVEMETEHAQRPGSQPPQETPEIAEDQENASADPAAPAESSGEPAKDEQVDDPWADEPDDFYTDNQGDSVAAIVAQLQQDVGLLKQSVDRSDELAPSTKGAEEGNLLISRRCRLTRSRQGAWIVVFDADSRGLHEPPMVLLPSTTLRSLEGWARATGMNRPLLISGQVYTYRGRHFLLPTAWRSPVERPNLK